MGTDIHMAVEVRKDGVWQNVTPFRNGYTPEPEYYEERNYDLFAILADVRNGYGFAGVVTSSGFVPLDQPRGIPPNASDDVRKWCEGGDHSHSYCTVAELLAYDWTRMVFKPGNPGGEVPYYACCRCFLSETMPMLWRLGAPEDVRIVFWFDS